MNEKEAKFEKIEATMLEMKSTVETVYKAYKEK